MSFCEREAVFYTHVVPFMNDDDIIHNIYLVSRNKNIYNRWCYLMSRRSSALLKKYSHPMSNDVERTATYLENAEDLTEILKDYIEFLLQTSFPDRNYSRRINKNMMKVARHIIPDETYFEGGFLSHMNTEYHQRKSEVRENVYVCAIYRLSLVEKACMLRKCKYAKALIY
jgi:hypothetical protein